MAVVFKVKALYDFDPKEEDALGFGGGQVIDVTEEIDDNWLEGRYTDSSGNTQSGIFPREFVEKYEPPVPARPSGRPQRKQDDTVAAATTAAAPPPAPAEETEDGEEPEQAPQVPAATKPQPPSVEHTAGSSIPDEPRSPPVASAQRSVESPAASKPAPAEPTKETPGKKAPPPIAAKSNAFRDRIAAFNQPAAAPVAPIAPGGSRSQGTGFIKKPFVAPPPMSNSYVPPPKPAEPVHKPYIREEDPEIRQRQEDDRAAAEAAGFSADPTDQQEEDDDAPKPQTLKERIARLQQQQMEQAQRRAEGPKEKKKAAPTKKPSESEDVAEQEAEDDDGEPERQASTATERQSLDAPRDRQRLLSAQLKPSIPASSMPTAPEHELVSDGNEADQSAAGETTEDDAGTAGPEDSDERHAPPPAPRAATASKKDTEAGDDEDTEEAEGSEEDSMDEETRRRMEIRERMAKMSAAGGMGIPNMFNPMGMPGTASSASKKRKEKKPSEEDETSSPPPPRQRIPMIPIPGLQRVASPDSTLHETSREADDEEQPAPPTRRSTHEERGAPPPVPKDSRPSLERGPPPLPPSTNALPTPKSERPVPPPPPSAAPLSPGPGSESDDEMSVHRMQSSVETSGVDTPGPVPLPSRQASGGAPPVPGSDKRASYFNSEPPSVTPDKRASRAPPPIPGSPVASARPVPPPPPQVPGRGVSGTHPEDDKQGESDYEGDYDTDIASSAKHKDALKGHLREPSLNDSTTADETPLSPPPPPPHASAPRAVPPPPPPAQAPPKTRQSIDGPRGAPPLPPTNSRYEAAGEGDEDYDPYRYDGRDRAPPPPVPGAIPIAAPPVPPPRAPEADPESSADEMYSTTPPRKSLDQPPRPVPAPPPAQPPAAQGQSSRKSMDALNRTNTTNLRRSMEQPRPSGDNGFIAQDLDLAESTTWWTAPQPLPPTLQRRNGVDILSESEESTTSKRGGKTIVSKDVYILYLDYSQTIITARYDSANPADAQLEQQHRPPPSKLRQDQLESYWQRFGRNIAETANALGNSKKDSKVGDGSSAALVNDLIKGNPAALQPVGNKSYGGLVYANLANASTQQSDEIRAGDIVMLRNARFEGTQGAMKHKYKQEYGTLHVAIVEEWDGTRKAIRAWEQGRDKAKVRSEKFRLGDLKSGEVKVWRVVGRDYVDWETSA